MLIKKIYEVEAGKGKNNKNQGGNRPFPLCILNEYL